ncbi:hypothetical protein [Staphylothermus hellenicus]|uniref:Uncharacterized protein n=1 Tax=Staphylothermus hellenicus (strain DSM 12710 / JCM 10830 / BK20S6-10-b1 / P8) TaxID=591019 RepID=D7D8J4_STAHD|nr:hypothetical protein [Staphylothermus hellenicus]ADI32090.1 hypothetical protein Shell_0984 [Staphylothermus hellenicus DSM 12710]
MFGRRKRKYSKDIVSVRNRVEAEKLLDDLTNKGSPVLYVLTSKIDEEKKDNIKNYNKITGNKPQVVEIKKFNEKTPIILAESLNKAAKNTEKDGKDLTIFVDIDDLEAKDNTQKYLVVRTIAEALDENPHIKKAVFITQRKDVKDLINYFNTE